MDRTTPSNRNVKQTRDKAHGRQNSYGSLPRRPPPPISMNEDMEGNLSPPPRRHLPPAQRPPPLPQGVSPPRQVRSRGAPTSEGKSGHTISRPTQAPNWPLPPGSPVTSINPEQYKPTQAPPRPNRPSHTPSIINQFRPQQQASILRRNEDSWRENRESGHETYSSTPATDSSRLTVSSVGTIPDFPTPGVSGEPLAPPIAQAMPPRRSANLGPPISGRRAVSSYYSNASFVSPIPEENSRPRLHESMASSAAMPEAWDARTVSPNTDGFYDDSFTDVSRDSVEYGDESKLVRSASIGKKGKASLVVNRPTIVVNGEGRPRATPVQPPFEQGTAYMDVSSSSSSALPLAKPSPAALPKERSNPLADAGVLLGSSAGKGLGEPDIRELAPSPKPTGRLQGFKRPPMLDIDAVREAEARGSITSLPDLIKRATRLAAMMDKGKRPGSRFDNLNDLLDEKYGLEGEKDNTSKDRHQSGLSDMLNAFPPPGQPGGRQGRGSWFRTTSWPLMPGRQSHLPEHEAHAVAMNQPEKKRRRCCGMPMWLFVLLVVVLLCVIAAAIVVPLQFFVFKNWGPQAEAKTDLENCQADLVCQNGGTNVLVSGTCSCICTNGFTGSFCSVEGSEGCTTTNLVSTDGSSNIDDVTLGRAIPRLIAEANANFSIPLSAATILANFNSGDLSCRAQNSLVTFDGRSTRLGEANAEVKSVGDDSINEGVNMAALAPVPTITIAPDAAQARYTLAARMASGGDEMTSLVFDTSMTMDIGAPGSTSTPDSDQSADFEVTEEVLDFGRVAVLYILQEKSSGEAESAQADLQRFFSRASEARGVTELVASNVTVGSDYSINLIRQRLNLGEGPVGR